MTDPLYREVFESGQDGIMILDVEGAVVREANRAMLELSGLPREEIIGRSLWQLGMIEDIASVEILFALLVQRAGSARLNDVALRIRDGRSRHAEFRFVSCEADGNPMILCQVRDVSELMMERDELAREANTDTLTGVFTRRHFMQCAQQELLRHQRSHRVLSALMIDIDHFKQFNDHHGHAGGDMVLRAVAGSFHHALREHDFVGRLGGEEFCVLLHDIGTEAALRIAERLRAAVETLALPLPGTGPSHPVPNPSVTISIGVGTSLPEETDLDALLARADGKLYEAKQSGRNRVCA